MHETQKQGIKGVTLDDIYLGNGASELIVMATNALLDNNDEIAAAAVARLSAVDGGRQPVGGTPVHYLCDEANGWMPDLDDIRAKVTPAPRALWSSTPTTPPVLCIQKNCCEAFWPSHVSMAWWCLRTGCTTRCCTTVPSTRAGLAQ